MHFNTTHYGINYEDAMQTMEADARKAVELDPSGPQPRAALAWYYFVSGRNKEAEVQLRSALEVNRANITLIKMAAAVFGSSGHPEEGVKLADKVLKLDPLATSGTLNTIKDAYYFSRRFEDAIAVISRVPRDSDQKVGGYFLLSALRLLAARTTRAAHATKFWPPIQIFQPSFCLTKAGLSNERRTLRSSLMAF